MKGLLATLMTDGGLVMALMVNEFNEYFDRDNCSSDTSKYDISG